MYETLKKFFAFCSEENRKKFHASIWLALLSSLSQALKIPAIGILITAFFDRGGITPTAIWLSFGVMVFSVMVTSLIKYKSIMLQTEAGYGTGSDKRIEIAEHMRYIPMGYFNENSLGRIMSVTTNTMENLTDVGTRVVLIVAEGILTTAAITLMVFLFDWRIGLIVLAGLALYAVANGLLQKAAQSKSIEKTEADALVVEKVMEYIRGISEVKAYSLSGKFRKTLEGVIGRDVKANQDMESRLVPFMALQHFVLKISGVLVAVASVWFCCSGSMSLTNAIMMSICSFLVFEGLETAGMYSSLLRVVDISVDKANEILSIKPMDIDGEDITPENHEIKAEDISFAYEEKKIIDGISLTIPEKTTTAMVGPSGGGKTTLCHLISRFWDTDGGRVTLGGRNIKDFSMDSLMKNFSFVFQNVFLFHDTIADNIRFGSPDATMDEVMEAAKKARCHEFIMKLPEGYDTVIGEDGGTLSGGERQRLSIARAMMKDSPVVILDEATANVDPENEKELMEAIRELTRDKTIIMIAHRMKTVRHADNIFVIDKGKIAEEGKHEELMANDGIYRRFMESRKTASGWKIKK